MLNRFEQFTMAVSGIHRCVQKIERDEMEKYGLKGAYAQYLTVMRRYPEGITSAKLCEVCDIDKAAVSRVIADMEKKGLVKRAGTRENNYRATVVLTEEGLHAAEYVRRRATVAVELAGKGMTDEVRNTFYSALGIIEENLQMISREGLPEQSDTK